MPNFLFFI